MKVPGLGMITLPICVSLISQTIYMYLSVV